MAFGDLDPTMDGRRRKFGGWSETAQTGFVISLSNPLAIFLTRGSAYIHRFMDNEETTVRGIAARELATIRISARNCATPPPSGRVGVDSSTHRLGSPAYLLTSLDLVAMVIGHGRLGRQTEAHRKSRYLS
jgi:hypothetical protein